MTSSMKVLLGSLAVAALTVSTAASAHPTGSPGGTMTDQGMTKPSAMQGTERGGMNMHQGQGNTAMPMQQHQGHMGNHHKMMMQGSMHGGGRGTHGSHGMMGSGRMGKGHHMDGVGKMGGMRVRPVQHLTIDDVTHFFGHHIERHDNKRLKLGEVGQKDEDTITAQIVTIDGSLVQAFEVDRHNGAVKRVD